MKKVNTATNFKNSQANLKNGFKKKKPLKNKEGKAQKKSYSTNIYIYENFLLLDLLSILLIKYMNIHA